MPASTLPQIKHVVFLMLENRSFDNLLGWLYSDGRTQPKFWPQGSRQWYDGLVKGKYRQPWSSSESYEVVPLPHEHAKKAVPAWDPYEEMYAETTWNGVLKRRAGACTTTTSGLPRRGAT